MISQSSPNPSNLSANSELILSRAFTAEYSFLFSNRRVTDETLVPRLDARIDAADEGRIGFELNSGERDGQVPKFRRVVTNKTNELLNSNWVRAPSAIKVSLRSYLYFMLHMPRSGEGSEPMKKYHAEPPQWLSAAHTSADLGT